MECWVVETFHFISNRQLSWFLRLEYKKSLKYYVMKILPFLPYIVLIRCKVFQLASLANILQFTQTASYACACCHIERLLQAFCHDEHSLDLPILFDVHDGSHILLALLFVILGCMYSCSVSCTTYPYILFHF